MEGRVTIAGEFLRRTDAPDDSRLPPRSTGLEDPFPAALEALLDPASPPMRWAIVRGSEADARAALALASRRRDRLIVVTGQPDADALLADLAPVLGTLLADMTPAQRRIARAILVDGRRQSEVADALGISRPSVSVAHARAHVREAALLLRAIRATWAAGLALRD